MSELLSQDEVNALLQSVPGLNSSDAGGAGPMAGGAYPDNGQPAPYRKRATRYDFKRPNRISKSVLERLHFVFERYAKGLTASVSAQLRSSCEVALLGVDQLSYGEFVLGLPEATCITVVRAAPQGARLAFEVSPALVFAIIEKLMGGNSEAPSQHRVITALEQSLVEDFIGVALGNLSVLWRTVGEADFAVERRETNPRTALVAAPNESVAVVVLEVKVGQAAGTMSFCLPAEQLAPFEAELPQGAASGADTDKDISREELARLDSVLAAAKVAVSANICKLRLPVRKLLELTVGETLPLGVTPSEPVTVSVTGVPWYKATYGTRKGRRAVRIIDTVENDDATREQESAPFKPVEVSAS